MRIAHVVPLALALLASGCAAHRVATPKLEPLSAARPPPPALTEDHFARDRGAVSEAQLRDILAAPVFLEEGARVGVAPVGPRYSLRDDVPLDVMPATLVSALEASGLVELSTEMSSDWPVAPGLSGLRELAARYRVEYVLLVRQAFAEATHLNGLAWGYITGVGALVLPGTSYEAAGVLEATLFDVKTGTVLFTVYERVRGDGMAAPPGVGRALEGLRRRLVTQGAERLAEQVLAGLHRLVASRPRAAPEAATVSVAPAY